MKLWKSNRAVRCNFIVVTNQQPPRYFGPWPEDMDGYGFATRFSEALLEEEGIDSRVELMTDGLIREPAAP